MLISTSGVQTLEIPSDQLTISMPLFRATPILVLCAPRSIPTTLIAIVTEAVEAGVQVQNEAVRKVEDDEP